jgi:glycerate kinase
VRVLIAPDCFGGTLTGLQAAEAMAAGWRRGAPHDVIALLPLSDGGPGFVDTLHAALGGDLVPVTALGPLGEPVPAVVLRTTTPGGVVAYLEAAQVVGLQVVPTDRRDPTVTTSAGLGELLHAAVDLGAARVVVGLGGSATNDAGAGMLAGLGLDGLALGGGGGGLTTVTADNLRGLRELRGSLAGVDLVVAADVDVPLLGLHGASAGFAAQKGATPEQAQHLERALGHFASVVAGALEGASAVRGGLVGLSVDPRTLAQLPGAGAAGGLGFGLAVLGARVLPGAEVVADAVGLGRHAAGADLLVTGEGALDWQSLHGKVVSAVAREGLSRGVPVVVVAGQVHLGRREWAAAGITGAYAVAETPDQVPRAVADAAGTLAARTERVARTWSPA